MMSHTGAPVVPQEVAAETVGFELDDAQQPVLQLGPLRRIDLTLEDRVLDPLAVVEASACHTAQPSPPLRRRRRDVIRHENQQALTPSFPEVGRVCVQVPAQMTGEEQRLQVDKHPDGGLLTEERVRHLLPLAFLISGQHNLARGVVHHDSA